MTVKQQDRPPIDRRRRPADGSSETDDRNESTKTTGAPKKRLQIRVPETAEQELLEAARVTEIPLPQLIPAGVRLYRYFTEKSKGRSLSADAFAERLVNLFELVAEEAESAQMTPEAFVAKAINAAKNSREP